LRLLRLEEHAMAHSTELSGSSRMVVRIVVRIAVLEIIDAIEVLAKLV
jgi:hypothetical protein